MESNTEFFVALFTENYLGLLEYADRKTKDYHLSEDLVMDTIACAWVHLDTLNAHPYPHKWLYKTLQNKILNNKNLKCHTAEKLTPWERISSLCYRVVVYEAPLQVMCYTVRDAVDW